jgi:hypothetical protein
MSQKNVTTKQGLVFKTTKIGDKTICGAVDGDEFSIHKFAAVRNARSQPAGHDPGYVYLAYLPKGRYKGLYKIGKSELTRIRTDDFNLDELDSGLLEYLYKRLKCYHPAKRKEDIPYDGAQFVHGIRVACGEGAEKQPHSYFAKKRVEKSREVFKLTSYDIEDFKSATGSVLDRPIKHLKAQDFANYLRFRPEDFTWDYIHQWVVLPKI